MGCAYQFLIFLFHAHALRDVAPNLSEDLPLDILSPVVQKYPYHANCYKHYEIRGDLQQDNKMCLKKTFNAYYSPCF